MSPSMDKSEVPKKESTDETPSKPSSSSTANKSTGATPSSKPKQSTGSVQPKSTGDSEPEAEEPEQQTEKPSDASSKTPAPAGGPLHILRNRPFILKTLKHEGTDGEETVTGSILSQSLDKMLAGNRADVEALTMAYLRKLVPDMSRYPRIDKFCTPSGTVIDDETISIADYLALEDSEETSAASGGTPSLKIHFRSTKLGASAGKGAGGVEGSSVQAPSLSEGPAVKAGEAPSVTNLPKPERRADIINTAELGFEMTSVAGAGSLSETQWAVVLRNCGVFYGWIIDPKTKRVTRAPKPAFQLRSRVDQEMTVSKSDFVAKSSADSADDNEDASTENGGEDSSSKSQADTSPRSEQGIPNFRVNDDSRIEITAHDDELSVAMARSDFSEKSTEVSTSAGGWGVSVGVSAGFAENKSSSSQTRTTSTNHTIVARYMFPRCDILLWPDEMEPTPELAELLETIRRTKNIKVLRRLHAEYGNLFCQNLTLGGRLLSTKVVRSNSTETLEEQKQSFKNSVGVSVSGSFMGFSASASMKHEEAKGSASSNETSSSSQDETCVFEAVGGETILATAPKSWSPTVGNHENWRVINREGLSPLVEILSGMPGYEAVQSWFVQAVPALSRYTSLNESHECKVRLRVMSPTNSLMMYNNGTNVSFYLGHDPAGTITPRQNLLDLKNFWGRGDLYLDTPMFTPGTYRAPAIYGYENFVVGDAVYGSKYNPDFVKTEWAMIAPFDEELVHGTRVIIRSCPFQDPSKPDQDGTTTNTNPSHMVVFRNAQGEFLPAMSDSDEFQYWRIIKTDLSKTRHIQPGDDIRLCWDFRDQTTGWRDFTNDVFGRRQPSPPADIAPGPLFLKVPWPRFESIGTPTALIMSADAGDLTTKPVGTSIKGVPGVNKYCMQDLHLRIDSIGNDGRGDAGDYMMKDVRQDGDKFTFAWRQSGYSLQMRQSMFWFGIH